jgi:hypothetical protein
VRQIVTGKGLNEDRRETQPSRTHDVSKDLVSDEDGSLDPVASFGQSLLQVLEERLARWRENAQPVQTLERFLDPPSPVVRNDDHVKASIEQALYPRPVLRIDTLDVAWNECVVEVEDDDIGELP